MLLSLLDLQLRRYASDLIFGDEVKGRNVNHKDAGEDWTPSRGRLGRSTNNFAQGDDGGRRGGDDGLDLGRSPSRQAHVNSSCASSSGPDTSACLDPTSKRRRVGRPHEAAFLPTPPSGSLAASSPSCSAHCVLVRFGRLALSGFASVEVGQGERGRLMGRVAVAVIVSLWVVPMSILVNRVVPEPFMDEIFHIPQAQQYCRGNFRSWDPMITTPPGLYYLSLAYVGILYPGMIFTRAISSFPDICSPAILRSVNGVLAMICSVLVYEIMTLLRPGVNDRNATACAVVLASYPLQWFFTFLYYTDAASLTMVLAMYLACLKKRYWISALLGSLSVIVRQTNIVWVLFAACTGIIDITLLSGKFHVKIADIDGPINEPSQLIRKKGKISSNLRRRKYNGAVDAGEIVRPTANIFSSEMPGLLDEIKAILSASWHMKWEILVHFVPFVMILVAFIAFIRWNGSIVLGAKDAHTVSPHFAQVMYFGLVSTLAMAPVHFSWGQAARISRSLWRNRPLSFLQVLIAICAGFLSVHFFSIAHPYLLADNRHYPFYLWRKVINAHWSMRYLLVPLYAYSWLSIFSVLGRYHKRIWIVAYFLATAAILVPAPLIEFRYYTVPFYLLMLHSNVTDNQSWFLMGFLYVVTNIFTMSMFLFRPFQWDHEPGIQRFIW
ncbi:hypothetical protein NL676_002958 [Syzygium grande]|nr:hypothetical protein NL676_002958 [Syzygium grande]